MTNDDGKTFLKITNKDIWEMLNKIKDQNDTQHTQIISRLDVTNGRVKFHSRLIWSSYGFSLTILGWFVYHLMV